MKLQTQDRLSVTISLTQSAHQLADKFCRYQSNFQKAEQVYLNTLAVYAVNYHLQCLGFATDWTHSESWDGVMQTFLDVADLEVINYGKLECRPVEPDAEVVYIPEEVWEERIGYIAVQIDELMEEATLLGFVATVSTPELALGELRSLTELPDYLKQFQSVQPVKESVNLSQWLHNLFEAGWETVEALFTPPEAEFAFSVRSSPSSDQISTIEIPVNGVKRGKYLELQRDGEIEPVVVFVGVSPSSSSQLDITVEVYPLSDQPYLPPELQVMILDDRGKSVLQAEAGSSESLEFQFSGEPGEKFSVKVALGNFSITEEFVI